jgi:hypothetical protein
VPASFLSDEQRKNYGRYTGVPSPHDLTRYFHLDDTDHAFIAKKRGEHDRLGFAVQLGTVGYLGTFLDDRLAVPAPVLHSLARQLRMERSTAHAITAPASSTGNTRSKSAPLTVTSRLLSPGWLSPYPLALRVVLHRYRPPERFVRAGDCMAGHTKCCCPGCSTLECYIARLRSRVEERLWRALAHGIGSELQARLQRITLEGGHVGANQRLSTQMTEFDPLGIARA